MLFYWNLITMLSGCQVHELTKFMTSLINELGFFTGVRFIDHLTIEFMFQID